MRNFYVALAALLVAATTPASMAEDTAVSFKDDIQPLLNAQCVFCHVTGAENGGLNVGRRQSHAALLAPSTVSELPRVTPGDPEKSYLIHKLRGTQLKVGGSGSRMPMTDPPRPMDAAQLELFERWIAQGAKNN